MRSEQKTPDQPGSDDKAARLAVTVFPVLVLLAGAAGLLTPGTFAGWTESVPYLLGVVMFCMGLTMTPLDFKGVAKRPWAVAIGLVAHYVIMPGLGWIIAHALGLPPQLAAGVILVGCAPSGTASNVVTFLARGDVALSVSVATVSTVLAPLVTPPLTLLLAGAYLPVDAGSMMTDILKTVLLPVIGGLVVRLVAGKAVDRVLGVMPWLSSLAVAAIVCAVVSGSADTIKSAAVSVLAAVVLHNGLGLALGYGAGKITGLGRPASRAMAFEVGMQNSGLAASLATAHFSPLAALPAAVFSVWHNISGALVAAWMSHSSRRRQQAPETGPSPAAVAEEA
ncbi:MULTISPECIES: bile acid:sodium symporter family protein [Streptomyces]|uniref:Bile acid:sodium symporter family protein n=2 Tax=Streptomyces TaxID=1883 RepID=A0ABU2RKU9_9ACTN|nr:MULTISPECIES: bile acid:sodium symporter family protein [unclassified Streptomyces]MBK3593745.1 bile acid:sodium symporter family protein [Streptomyces sp. MBT51]MDT0429475.1 bile acid:sodium symporter family protein [Streptomyces sp. DSM 41770]HBF85078.1 Bile acid:sodium symporter [Streptomyces sp.]